MVMVEATAVTPEGRISPGDMGLWQDAQIEPLQRIAAFVQSQGAVPAIQIAHAGRKASCDAPWNGGNSLTPEQGGWSPVLAPSAIPFDADSPTPKAMTDEDIQNLRQAFKQTAQRALEADFQVLELHAAHGYLLNEFLSPLANHRTDAYGGSFENRIRLLKEITADVREVWPERYPLFVRISATDWKEGGWTVDDSVALAAQMKQWGVDVVDVSSGGMVPDAKITVGPGYQVPFAEQIRKKAGIATAAVGMITEPQQAEDIIRHGQADMVLLAREFLRDPYWPLHAAHTLGEDVAWPKQYQRSKPRLPQLQSR
jgi:2,4-dienoyl-CoA reductase-like NADH-dependent reductase (Old Yellow Enzyme family)